MAGGGKIGWKVVGGLAGAVAGAAARKLLTAVWKKVTGHEPPENPVSPETTWPEALGWAVVSGVAIGVARLYATRKAAETWARSTGGLPPGLEDAS